MENIQICAVVRIYDEAGDYSEMCYDNVCCELMPEEDLKVLASGEVICVEIAPNAEAFYFMHPEDWPNNWSEKGACTKK